MHFLLTPDIEGTARLLPGPTALHGASRGSHLLGGLLGMQWGNLSGPPCICPNASSGKKSDIMMASLCPHIHRRYGTVHAHTRHLHFAEGQLRLRLLQVGRGCRCKGSSPLLQRPPPSESRCGGLALSARSHGAGARGAAVRL